jgi:spore coat protein U-like protein
MSAYTELLERIPSRPTRRVSVTCVTESPFTVYIDGDSSVAVRARVMAGSTFTSGESGLAYWTSPSLPECFKVT